MWSFDSAAALDAKRMRTEFMVHLRAGADADGSDFEAAELIYAELLGNVMRHAPGRVTVDLNWERNGLHLRVHDTVKAFKPDFQLPSDELQEHGRGLFIVKALSKSVEVRDFVNDGSEIEAVLPVAPKQPS